MSAKNSTKKTEEDRRVSVHDFQRHAQEILPKMVYDYYASGATDMRTLRDNEEAFGRIRMRPRVLVDVSKVDTSTSVLGRKVDWPIFVAPTAMHGMAHESGEVGSVQAAVSCGSVYCMSTWSTRTLEEVARAAHETSAATGKSPRLWLQLYVQRDRKQTEELVRRALTCGFEALVVTVDTPILGKRENDVRNSFALPAGLTLPNFPAPSSLSPGPGALNEAVVGTSFLARVVMEQQDSSLCWDEVRWLQSLTQNQMKVLAKGITRADDAVRAVQSGLHGIVVSNHGARQVDTQVATIDALEEVVVAARALNPEFTILLDGGVRRGLDVIKAIALGADAVLVGRPVLWGLASGGREGVEEVLRLLQDELLAGMKLCGCPSIKHITPDLLLPSLTASVRWGVVASKL